MELSGDVSVGSVTGREGGGGGDSLRYRAGRRTLQLGRPDGRTGGGEGERYDFHQPFYTL